jgi:hypothetical protein
MSTTTYPVEKFYVTPDFATAGVVPRVAAASSTAGYLQESDGWLVGRKETVNLTFSNGYTAPQAVPCTFTALPGGLVHFYMTETIAATDNTEDPLSDAAVPEWARPLVQYYGIAAGYNNSVAEVLEIYFKTAGTVTISRLGGATFTATNNKGANPVQGVYLA